MAESYADKLARLAAIGYAEQSLPRDLAEWACANLRDLEQLRARQPSMPPSITGAVRDRRIVAAARLVAPASPWDVSRQLHAEAQLIRTGRVRLPSDSEPGAACVRGELQAAHRWHELPDSTRTFFRLLTKHPLGCQ